MVAARQSTSPATARRTEDLRLGRFYTPRRVVDLALSIVAALDGPVRTVWDPTCGAGAFLRPAAGRWPDATLLGTDLDSAALASLADLGATLRTADLFALTPSDLPPQDLILGNPPFLRSERIPAADRERIRASLDLPVPVPRGVDTSLLALLHASRFLAPGGRLAFVLPSTALDTAAGAPLRRWLAATHHVHTLVEPVDDPWFTDAAVHAVLVVLQRAAPGPPRLLRIRGTTTAPPPAGRLVDAARIAAADQWSPLLRAPDSWFTVLERLAPPPLSASLDLAYGLKPGITGFFAPRTPPDVEPDCLVPFLRSLRPIDSYVLDPADVSDRLFLPPDPPPPKAAAWIAAGAASRTRRGTPYPEVPSVRTYSPWWRLPAPASGPVLVPQFRAARHHVIDNPHAVPVNNSAWFGRWRDPDDHPAGIALLNTSLLALAAEVLGRTNLGDGLLTLYGPELAALPLPSPATYRNEPALADAWARLSSRPVLPFPDEAEQPDRHALDAALLAPHGLLDVAPTLRADAVALLDERLQRARKRRSARAAAATIDP